jgi:hypothetical protein
MLHSECCVHPMPKDEIFGFTRPLHRKRARTQPHTRANKQQPHTDVYTRQEFLVRRIRRTDANRLHSLVRRLSLPGVEVEAAARRIPNAAHRHVIGIHAPAVRSSRGGRRALACVACERHWNHARRAAFWLPRKWGVSAESEQARRVELGRRGRSCTASAARTPLARVEPRRHASGRMYICGTASVCCAGAWECTHTHFIPICRCKEKCGLNPHRPKDTKARTHKPEHTHKCTEARTHAHSHTHSPTAHTHIYIHDACPRWISLLCRSKCTGADGLHRRVTVPGIIQVAPGIIGVEVEVAARRRRHAASRDDGRVRHRNKYGRHNSAVRPAGDGRCTFA